MGLIFDTSILIDIKKKINSSIEQINEISKNYLKPGNISFITYSEYYYGLKEKSIKNLI